jgi:hypothetical protein
MSPVPGSAISIAEGEITVDAELLAFKLGLSAKALQAWMRKGIVSGVAETGINEDIGRTRLTFRHHSRAWTVVVEADGTVVENPDDGVASPTHTDRLNLNDFVRSSS